MQLLNNNKKKKKKKNLATEESQDKVTAQSIRVFDVVIPEEEVISIRDGFDDYLSNHADKTRNIVSNIVDLRLADVESNAIYAFDSTLPDKTRAGYAWENLAWYTFVNPYSFAAADGDNNNKDRESVLIFPKDRYLSLIRKSSDHLFLYAIFIQKIPDRQTYDALKNMNVFASSSYLKYAKNMLLNEDKVDYRSLYPW